jgi:hypothetical protein
LYHTTAQTGAPFWTVFAPGDTLGPGSSKSERRPGMAKPRRRRKVGSKKRKARRDRRKR